MLGEINIFYSQFGVQSDHTGTGVFFTLHEYIYPILLCPIQHITLRARYKNKLPSFSMKMCTLVCRFVLMNVAYKYTQIFILCIRCVALAEMQNIVRLIYVYYISETSRGKLFCTLSSKRTVTLM